MIKYRSNEKNGKELFLCTRVECVYRTFGRIQSANTVAVWGTASETRVPPIGALEGLGCVCYKVQLQRVEARRRGGNFQGKSISNKRQKKKAEKGF